MENIESETIEAQATVAPEADGTTQASESDLVEITQASDEDLEAFLKNSEKNPEQEPATEDEPKPKKEEKPQEAESPATEEEEQTETKAAELEKENKQLRKALEDSQHFIQRRSQEIGDLRKQLREQREIRAKGLEEKFQDNPLEAVEDKLAISKLDDALKQIDVEEQSLAAVGQRQQLVHSHIPPEEFDIEEMAASLRRDGLEERYINSFVKNPYAVAQGETLIQLHHRARAESYLAKLVQYTKKIKGELDGYKKGSIKLDKLNDAMRKGPSINGSVGQASHKRSGSNLNPTSMSEAEINAYLAQART